ncbi:epoxide hydrolase 1 [Daldinia caldariorum]|uniref:epoxide hydrolase 1 n=1 Tax=Daldinia caldariorum TaxID=326644 RepID=UPI00200867E0|nr:epoxide hydrolase 1 [Daldinia caldariorum]KAI1469322.1 epoxide hydrolase 1 [Daldinia caldariorum]
MISPSAAIEPFRIAVPDHAIETLKAKLALATFPRETTFSNDSNYGAQLDDIKRLATAWRDTFDWRAAEAKLNDALPQFTTKIAVDGHEDDLKVHFVHAKSERKDAIPLLFCHGWPGSFLEVIKILPLLTAKAGEDEPAFHVVAPSLPNFGFSQGTSKPGFGILQHAEVCHKLMLRLGYGRYATQGGDWGSPITRAMGALYPDHVVASHLNYLLGTSPPTLFSSPLLYLRHALDLYTPAERAGLARTRWFRDRGSGYAQLHGTRPHTVGFALADSPVGLLAWIREKLVDWTDAYPWTDDEVLTWVSVYAFSEAGPDASVRLYYETVNRPSDAALSKAWNGKVPLGLSHFPMDVTVVPSSWAKLGPVVFEKRHEHGGHFAAFEKPDELVADLRTMFGKKSGIGAKLPF